MTLRNRWVLAKSKANSIANNLEKWSAWDWSRQGEEWSNDPAWKESLVQHVLEPNVPDGSCVLEIGPGAGRWTEYLAKRTAHLIVVDLTPKCIELCRERFKEENHIEYFVNDGSRLDFIVDHSIDCIWSWDVFVHIQSEDVRKYIQQFARILRPGGQAVIHHSKNGRSRAGWRSDMTAEKMSAYCREFSLEIVEQFDAWDAGRVRIWPTLPAGEGPDIISIIRKRSKNILNH